jgi:hypothetical protein
LKPCGWFQAFFVEALPVFLPLWDCWQRPVCRTGGRVTFLSATRKLPKKRVCRRLPAELAVRLQRYAQTAAGDLIFYPGHARRLRAREVEALALRHLWRLSARAVVQRMTGNDRSRLRAEVRQRQLRGNSISGCEPKGVGIADFALANLTPWSTAADFDIGLQLGVVPHRATAL